jgi:hypothetical protein
VSNNSNASFISCRCSSVISCRTFEWSREEGRNDLEEDDDESIGLCCGDEFEGNCGLLRGLVALDGYILRL